jgi:hypothetical protein
MKDGYKSINEILKEVAEEEGMPLKEIIDLWKHQKTYIKKLMDAPNIFAIFLPYIGTLSLNVKQYTKEIKNKSRSLHSGFIDKVAILKTHPEYSQFGNSHKRVTGVNRLTRYIIRTYETGLKRSNRIIEHTKCWDIISKYSNDIYKKKEE